MNTRSALAKSLLIAPAELAMQRCETQAELEDAWFIWADGFADASAERKQLQRVYQNQLDRIRKREVAAHHMPRILGAG